MQFTKPRATLEEVLAFANAVREAGGGNPLDALMPAVPRNSKQCLIARNLNFNCVVRCHEPNRWLMATDEHTRDAIAVKLGLSPKNFFGDNPQWSSVRDELGVIHAVILPPEIGQVAQDFDDWSMAAHSVATLGDIYRVSNERDDILTTFSPYVEASYRETETKGKINERGELVL